MSEDGEEVVNTEWDEESGGGDDPAAKRKATTTNWTVHATTFGRAFIATALVRAMVGLFYVGGQFAVEHTVANWATMGTMYVTVMAALAGGLDMFLLYMGVFSGLTANVIGLAVGKTTLVRAAGAILGSLTGELAGVLLLRLGILTSAHTILLRGLETSLFAIIPLAVCHGLLYVCVFFVLRPVDMNGVAHAAGGGVGDKSTPHLHEGRTVRTLFAGVLLALGHALFVLLWDGTHTPIFDSLSLLALLAAAWSAPARWWTPLVYNAGGTLLALGLYFLLVWLYPDPILEGEAVDVEEAPAVSAPIGVKITSTVPFRAAMPAAHMATTPTTSTFAELMKRKYQQQAAARTPVHGWRPKD